MQRIRKYKIFFFETVKKTERYLAQLAKGKRGLKLRVKNEREKKKTRDAKQIRML